MIRVVRAALLLVAVEAAWAICAAFVTDTNPYPAVVVLVVAAVGLTETHHLERARDRRTAEGRAGQWARRDGNAGAP